MNGKLFKINSYGDDFQTGVCADGRLVLMGLYCPSLLAVLFDSSGKYSGSQTRKLQQPPQRMETVGLSPGPFDIYDKDFQIALADDVARWQTELGFKEGAIEILAFFDEEHGVGIERKPADLAEFEQNPDAFDDLDEKEELAEALESWNESENFILWWGKDYWFGPDGEVEST